MTKKLKYQIELQGIYDYKGDPVSHQKFIDWLSENCKNEWKYFSPDVKYNGWVEKRKPDSWPKFYTMIFSFKYKKEFNKFLKRFT